MTLTYIVYLNASDIPESYATLEEAIARVDHGNTHGTVIVRTEYTTYEGNHTTEAHLGFTN